MLLMIRNNVLFIAAVCVACGLLGIFLIASSGSSAPALYGNTLYFDGITTFDMVGNELLVGTDGMGLYSCNFDTQSLIPRNTGLDYQYPLSYSAVTSLAGASSSLYLSFNHGYIMKSTSSGQTWTYAGSPFGCGIINAIAVAPNNASHVLVGSETGLYESHDGGESFELHSSSLRVSVHDVVFASAGTIYVAASVVDGIPSGRVYKTVDSGVNWTYTSLPCQVDTLVIDPVDNSIVYALNQSLGTNRGNCPLISTNSGASFGYFSPDLPNRFIYCLVVSTSGSIYIGTDVGIYEFLNEEWKDTQITGIEVFDMVIAESVLYYGNTTELYRYVFS